MKDTLHTHQQRQEKLHGLVNGVRLFGENLKSGNISDKDMLRFYVDSLLVLAEEAERCIDMD